MWIHWRMCHKYNQFCISKLDFKDPITETTNKRSRSVKTKTAIVTLFNNTGTLQVHVKDKDIIKSNLRRFLQTHHSSDQSMNVSSQSSS